MIDLESLIGAVDERVIERPERIVVGFLVVTAVFAVGLGAVSTESGTSQFTQDLPAQQALENVNRKFTPPFAPDTGSTQLIQSRQNVLSKRALLHMLEVQRRLEARPGLRVASTQSAASIVARTLDPNAATVDAQRRAVERATPGEIDAAVRANADNGAFTSLLSDDFNSRAATASATVGVVQQRLPAGLSATAAGGGANPLTSIQLREQTVVASVSGDIRVFGSGLVSAEFANVISDSLIIVVPAAIALILAFLVLAYRDLVDLLLGVVSLAMAIVWTFGFMGLVGIAFSQLLIAVPPLLLAVGIDFGIHSINRYREERVTGVGIEAAMSTATRQLLVAFFIVTGTTVVGFAANVTSALGPIRDFGVVAAVGITFTFLIFGVFLPATKVLADRARSRRGTSTLGRRPLGSEGSLVGTATSVGVVIARRGPTLFLVVIIALGGVSGYYGLGVDTTFSQQDFLPPKQTPGYLDHLPEPFRPHTYTVTRDTDFLDRKFPASQGSTVIIYVRGPFLRDSALESLASATRDPPTAFVATNRRADTQSIVTVIRDHANESGQFRRLVARNDADGDGIPDSNLGEIYRALFASSAGDRARQYLTENTWNARVVYQAKSNASQATVTSDAREVARQYRFEATATGQDVVFQAVSDTILASALRSLAVALGATALFLFAVYYGLEGDASLGVVNLVPIVLTVTFLAGSMRLFGLPLNALTATILSITIGLGTDYSAHVVHRFIDEFEAEDAVFDALDETMRGTGGALTGSMVTTVTGVGVLVLAITPILGQFGLLTGLSILYSYVTSIVVTPSVIALWARYVH